MQDFETLCFQNREDWLRLLKAYALSEESISRLNVVLPKPSAAPAVFAEPSSDSEAEESATGWVTRIAQVEGVAASQMSTLHGRVIALGYLKFKLIDRQVGLRYRLTPTGKQLAQALPEIGEAAA